MISSSFISCGPHMGPGAVTKWVSVEVSKFQIYEVPK